MLILTIFLIIGKCMSGIHNVDEVYINRVGNDLSLTVVEYVTPSEKSGPINSLFFMGNDNTLVQFNLEFKPLIAENKIDAKNHYMMAEPVSHDFEVDCDKSKEITNKVTEAENGSFIMSGEKVITSGENGFHAFYVCSDTKVNFEIKGQVIYRHKHGFIDAGYFGYIPFQFGLTTFYAAVCCLWLGLLAKHKENIMFHHKILTVILIGTCIDEFLKAKVMNAQNLREIGNNMPVIYIEAIFHAARESLVRYIALMMARGWGMAQSNVEDKWKLQAYSATYFIIAVTYSIGWNPLQRQYRIHDLEKNIILLLCFLDSLWATYVLASLRNTFSKLHESKQNAKALFYERVSYLIMGGITIAILLAITSILFLNTSWRNHSWTQSWFYIEGCWRLLFAIVLLSFLHIFRPQKGSKFYADAQQLPQEEEYGLEEFDCETPFERSLEGSRDELMGGTAL